MKKRTGTVLSVIKLETSKIGGFERYLHEFHIQLKAAGCDSVLCLPCLPAANVCEYLAASNVRIEVAPELFHHSVACYRRFRSILLKYRPRIVHVQFASNFPLFPAIAKWHKVEQLFFTDHGSRDEHSQPQRASKFNRTAVRLLAGSSTTRISVSEYVNQCSKRHGALPHERYLRIYNGIDLSKAASPRTGLAYRERMGIPEDAIVVAQVSQMIPEKGWDDLIAAASTVLETDRQARMLFVGDGPHLEDFKRKTKALPYGDRILFPGQSADPMTEGVFAAADIICQASRWNEAFGFAIAEGMAHAKPVVATRVGGIPEVIEHGTTGLLVERGNHDALARAILRLIADPQLRTKYGEAGYRKAQRQFSLRTQVAQLLDLYGVKPKRFQLDFRQVVETSPQHVYANEL